MRPHPEGMTTAPARAKGGRPNVVRHSDRSVTIFDYNRTRSLNDERRKHWAVAGRETEAERERWGWLIKAARLEHMTAVAIIVTAGYRRSPQDPGNCYPTAKAAIDALKDAGVIDDDNGNIVRHLGFQVDMDADVNYLALTINDRSA